MTPAELERRRNVVGASEVGLLFGLPAFGGKTIADMDFEKRYGVEREWKGNESTKLGNKLEPTILEMAEEKLGCKITCRQKWVTRDFNGATLDGVVSDSGAVIDAKTSGILGPSKASEWGDELSDSIPDYYLLQLHSQMLVTGSEMAYLAALIGGRGFCLFQVEASPVLQSEISLRSEQFIKSLSTNVAYPEPPQLETLKRIRRQPNKVLPRSDESDQIHEDFSKWKEIAKTDEQQKELANRKLLEFMGDAEAIEVESGRYTYFQQSRKESFVSASTFRVLRFQKGK